MNQARDGVPEDYPGRVVAFPPGVEHLVFGMYGVQSPDPVVRDRFIQALSAYCALPGGPGRIERCQFVDSAGYDCDMLVTYGTDPAANAQWWARDDINRWWRALFENADPETGYWREVSNTRRERFNYAAGTEDRVGSAAILPIAPSKTFGYWGAYRDRIPASVDDDFASPLAQTPPRRVNETRGRIVSVRVPDNLCVIREGQGWGDCATEEKTVWDERMADVIDEWVDFLGSDPQATGCMTIRSCREHDVASGAAQSRQSQFAFLLSLGHIEHAARTQVAHLAVHGAFIKMHRDAEFTPRMHVWVEVHILKAPDLCTEYMNCHPDTGLLPFFDAEA